ncbi:MAG: heme o synthase [Dehalococcoidia bacterium]
MTSRSAKLAPTPNAATGVTGQLPATGRIRNWSGPDALESVRAYVALTKPGIIWLLLVTTVPAMILAADGWPGLDLIALTLLGGILTAGGANAINQWFDRDIDSLMSRTADRPIPAGRVTPTRAFCWGLLLIIVGGVQLAVTVNWLSALWALVAVGFYLLVYTAWLKRWTTQNIVVGGAAGAVPPLVGWAAVRDSVDLAPVFLFLIVFLWTPPHFWALALRYKADYINANVPMLPVVRGDRETKKQIFWYAVALAGVSFLLPIFGEAGAIYTAAAGVLGAAFVAQAARVWSGRVQPMALFFFSIVYLPLLFLAAALDELVL